MRQHHRIACAIFTKSNDRLVFSDSGTLHARVENLGEQIVQRSWPIFMVASNAPARKLLGDSLGAVGTLRNNAKELGQKIAAKKKNG